MHITIYTKSNCNYCTRAKSFLNMKHMAYEELVLDQDFTRENLLDTFPNVTSFPVIVVDGMNIGGFDQLKLMLEEQQSDPRKLLNEEFRL